MAMHTYLQQHNIPFESSLAVSKMHQIFGNLHEKIEEANVRLGKELGPCPNAAKVGLINRFSNTTAIAPTASISHIAGSVSPGIDPILNNYHVMGNKDGFTSWKNPNLKIVIDKYAKENNLGQDWVDEQWDNILSHEGSVQQLNWLDQWTKDVFKTAYELDQNWVVELAAARQKYIDQTQSLNLYFKTGMNRQALFNVYIKAWASGCKTLYYSRAEASSRANDSAVNKKSTSVEEVAESGNDYAECLACQ